MSSLLHARIAALGAVKVPGRERDPLKKDGEPRLGTAETGARLIEDHREVRPEPALAKAAVRVADVTGIPTGAGWLCPAVILDLCTRKVVGEARAPAPNSPLPP